MLVYGDAQEQVAPRPALAQIEQALSRCAVNPNGLARHSATVEQFIALAGLVQGFADAEAEQRGHDELSEAQAALLDALRLLAIGIDRSWQSGFEHQPPANPDIWPRLHHLPWPEKVTVRRCEGYAFYGLYPESYLEAARSLPPDTVMVGLRSIGTGLAALAAAAAGPAMIVTVRPTGHPFARGVRAGPKLEAAIRGWAHRRFAIVDEGPGLSGSSFGGTADWLAGLGVSPERITFLPSHAGDLGDQALPAYRQRWALADKRVRSFEELFTDADAPASVRGWFDDVIGGVVQPAEGLSGGRWAVERPGVPTSPSREARKYRLTGHKGSVLAKFAGLDRIGRAKFDRARALHEGGFCAEPLAMRYGLMAERWVEGMPVEDVPLGHLIDYLSFREDRLPAERAGASLVELLAMATHNLGLVDPDAAAALAARWSEARARTLQAVVAPVHVDSRLHRWEWLMAGGRLVKTDAVDHSEAHDLVGCQDILWDVAGAVMELPGAAAEGAALARPFVAGSPARRELLELMTLCYLAFQMGWWSMSGTQAGEALSRSYQGRLVAEVERLG